MSQEITWQLLRKHNSYVRKRDGVVFSAEPNNLLNKHSFKFSGLANKNAVGVDFNRDAKGAIIKGAVLITKNKRRQNRPAQTWNKTVLKKDFRRAAKAIRSQTEGKYYRRDLTQAALARLTKIHQAK